MLKLHGLFSLLVVMKEDSLYLHILRTPYNVSILFIWLAKIRSAALSAHLEGIFQTRRQFLWRFFKAASATHSALSSSGL